MLNSQLLQTLRLLTQEEFEALPFFVASPIFNDSERYHDANQLFDYIRTTFPTFSDVKLSKDIVGITLFPGRRNPKDEVEKAMSPLLNVVKQFINFRYSTVRPGTSNRLSAKGKQKYDPVTDLLNETRQNLALLRFYSERIHTKPRKQSDNRPVEYTTATGKKIKDQEKFFLNLYTNVKKSLATSPDFSQFEEHEFSDFFLFKYQLEHEKSLFDSLQEGFKDDGNLLNTLESLDEFYLLSKLDLLSRLVHQNTVAQPYADSPDDLLRFNNNFKFTTQTVKILQDLNYLISPTILMYCKLLEFQISVEPHKTDHVAIEFNEMLNNLNSSMPNMRRDDNKVLLHSYWSIRYNETNERKALEILHELQKEQIDRTQQLRTGISSSHFQNIVQVALKLDKIEWAEHFLTEYERKITQTQQGDLVAAIFWAILRFTQKRYRDASKYMPHYMNYGELDDTNLQSIAARADIKLRYELDTLYDDEYGFTMFRATQQRISRVKNVSPEQKSKRLNFYVIIRRLFTLKTKVKRAPKSNIEKDLIEIRGLLNTLSVVEKEWLEEKYAELS